MPVRVLIVDDHERVREALQIFLLEREDIMVVGEAGNGEEAIQRSKELQPDVILMDLVMPKMSGIEASKAIADLFPKIRIIILTSSVDHSSEETLHQTRAWGYLTKMAGGEEIAKTIRAAIS